MSSFYSEYDQGRKNFQLSSGCTPSGSITHNFSNNTSEGKEIAASTNHFHAQNQSSGSCIQSGSSFLPKIEMGHYFSDSHQHFKQQISISHYTNNPSKETEHRKTIKTSDLNREYTNHHPHLINPQVSTHPHPSSLPQFGKCNTDDSTNSSNESAFTPKTIYSSKTPEIFIKSEPSSRSNYSLPILYSQATMTTNSSQILWNTKSQVTTQIPVFSNNSYSLVQENHRNVGLIHSSPQSYPLGNSSSFANCDNNMSPCQFASSSSASITKDTYPLHPVNTFESSNGAPFNLYPSSVKQTNYQEGSSNIYSAYQQNRSLSSNSSFSTSLNTSSAANNTVVVERPYHSSSLITETKLRSMLIAPPLEEYVPMKPFVSTHQTQNLHCYPTVLNDYKQMPPKIYHRQQNQKLPPMYLDRTRPIHPPSSSPYVMDEFKQHSYQHVQNGKQKIVFCDSITLTTASNSTTRQLNGKDKLELPLKNFQIAESNIQTSSRNNQGLHFNGIKKNRIPHNASHPFDKDRKCNCNQTCHDCLPRSVYYPCNTETPKPQRRCIENNLEKQGKHVDTNFTNLYTSIYNESRRAPNFMHYKTEMLTRNTSIGDVGQQNHNSFRNSKDFQVEPTDLTNTRGRNVIKSVNDCSKYSSNSIIHSDFEETQNFKFPRVIESPIKFRTKGELKQICQPPAQTEQDPIISDDEWFTWSSSFSNEWEKFMNNLSTMKNVKRINRVPKFISKSANLDSSFSFTSNPKDEYLSEEDVPLSVRRQKTKRPDKLTLKRKKSEDLSQSDLLSTHQLDTLKQESRISEPVSKPLKLEIITNDVLPVENKDKVLQPNGANFLEIKTNRQQVNSEVLTSESAVTELPSSEYLKMSYSLSETTLHHTAYMGQLQAVRSLLDQPDTDISLKDSYGYTALEIACTKGHVDVAKVLLEYGANTNLHSQNDIIRSLKEAIKNDHIEVARLLLSYGAELASVDENVMLYCKSESMKEFLSAYINDFNGNTSSSWGFLGSVCFMDATTEGFNVLDCSVLE